MTFVDANVFFFVMYGLCVCDLLNVCVYVTLAHYPSACAHARALERASRAAARGS